MSIAHYIREIGRGKEGARSLDHAQAHDLMSQVLDGKVSDLEVGAFAIGMRVKGETVDELAGFLQAVTERCVPLNVAGPTVVLPSYNGARKLPNLTALLALLLAQEGVRVLVHGPASDPGRVTTAEIFASLGLPFARDAGDVDNAWSRREPVFMHTEALCPPLARLLEVRRVIGSAQFGPHRRQAAGAGRRRRAACRQLHPPRIRHAAGAVPCAQPRERLAAARHRR